MRRKQRIPAKRRKRKVDGQLIELAGRNWLVSQLIQAGIEVARPERDHGIDLIAYVDPPHFMACPIQVKASSGPSFTAYEQKYRGMLLVFVWYVNESTKTVAYAMTFTEAHRIAVRRGWVNKPAWGKYKSWHEPRPGVALQGILDVYKMNPAKWKATIDSVAKKKFKLTHYRKPK